MCFDRLLLSARESQQLNSKDFYKLVVKSLVAWNLPRWEHSANTTNQVIFSFIFFPFLSLFYFCLQRASLPAHPAFTKGPCRGMLFWVRVAASGREKGLVYKFVECHGNILQEKRAGTCMPKIREWLDPTPYFQYHPLEFHSWDYKKCYAQEGWTYLPIQKCIQRDWGGPRGGYYAFHEVNISQDCVSQHCY